MTPCMCMRGCPKIHVLKAGLAPLTGFTHNILHRCPRGWQVIMLFTRGLYMKHVHAGTTKVLSWEQCTSSLNINTSLVVQKVNFLKT